MATIIYNFIAYTSWLNDTTKEKTICVLGKTTVTEQLYRIQEKREGFKIERKSLDSQMEGCHILFITSDHTLNIKAILNKIKDLSILSISPIKGFSKEGGVVTFLFQGQKVNLEINLAAMKRANIQIRSDVLRLMKVINQQEKNNENKYAVRIKINYLMEVV